MSRARDAVECAALRALFWVCARIGEDSLTRFGNFLGDLVYDVVRVRRDVTHANLRRAFPDWDDLRIRRTSRECYRTFAKTVVEFARLPAMGEAELVARVAIEGREWLEQIRNGGTGAILLTGHFGNWEYLGALFPAMGMPIDVVVAEQRNRKVDAVMNRIRRSRGVGVLSAVSDLRGIYRSLKAGRLVAIVADQDAGRDGIFVDFLGTPASTAIGPAVLARRFGVPILQGYATRVGPGRHRMELIRPIRVETSGDEASAVRAATESWVRALEAQVRARPDHWFWMHRRWKTRPREDGAPQGEDGG